MTDKFLAKVGAIVYGLAAIFTIVFMMNRSAPLHTFKDFLEWLLLFLAIAFVCWLIAYLVLFIYVKYRDRT